MNSVQTWSGEKVKTHIEWAKSLTSKHGDRVKAILDEELGADYIYTKCDDDFHRKNKITGCVDYQVQCNFCGSCAVMGSVDIYEGQETEAYQKIANRIGNAIFNCC